MTDPFEPELLDDEPEPGVDPELRRARRRLLRQTLRPYVPSLAVAAVAIGVSTAAVLAMPYLVKRGIDDGIRVGDGDVLGLTFALFLVAALTDAAAQRGALRLTGRVAERSIYDLRLRLWRHVQSLSLEFFERQKSGRVISRATSDVEAVYELFATAALTLVSNLLVIMGIVVVLFRLDLVLALVVMGSVPLLLLGTWVFRIRSERAYRAVREKIALVIIHLAETLTGVRVVQAFSREPINQAQFDDVNRQHRDASAETVLLFSVYGPGVDLVGQLTLAAVLIVGAFRALDGLVTIGVITAFILYMRQFFDPLQELSQFQNSLQAANAGLEKIAAVLRTESTVPERPGAPDLTVTGGEVHLDAVTFAYRDTPVLHKVDLVIPSGETLALVGATGAGKSTIAKLVARFYDPTQGRVLIDGQDLREVSVASLRRAIAIVPQEAFLFGGTIHDNIALGRPGATREQVEAAAWAVGAHAFISAMPDAYDTDVNKRGARLSGGQRQLISFARAWLVEPRVLILDEATSSLDLASERLIQRALRQLLAERTAIVIAHRFSSIEVADRVAVIEDGRIVELGTQAELAGRDTRFRALQRTWEATLVWGAEAGQEVR